MRWQSWLLGILLIGMVFKIVPALSHNLRALQLLHTNLSPYISWYNELPPAPCSELACSHPPLDTLWQARTAWRAGKHEQACNLWWSLNANNDPWTIAQTTNQWTEVAQALSCLDRWQTAQPQQPLINGIYGGWIAQKYADLATFYQSQSQLSQAVTAYQRALDWDPQPNAGYILEVANIWLQMEQFAPAHNWVLNQHTRLHNPDTQYILLINWAETLLSKGYKTEGISTLSLILQTTPNLNPYPYLRLVHLYLEQDQPTLALPVLQQAWHNPLFQQPKTRHQLFFLSAEVYRTILQHPPIHP